MPRATQADLRLSFHSTRQRVHLARRTSQAVQSCLAAPSPPPQNPPAAALASRPRLARGIPGEPPPPRKRERLRSEEHTSELQSLMRISYAVFCLKKKKETLNMHMTT